MIVYFRADVVEVTPRLSCSTNLLRVLAVLGVWVLSFLFYFLDGMLMLFWRCSDSGCVVASKVYHKQFILETEFYLTSRYCLLLLLFRVNYKNWSESSTFTQIPGKTAVKGSLSENLQTHSKSLTRFLLFECTCLNHTCSIRILTLFHRWKTFHCVASSQLPWNRISTHVC